MVGLILINNSMKYSIISILFFPILLTSCSKNIPEPIEEPKIIRWQWETNFKNPGNGLFRSPVINNDYLILPAASQNQDANSLTYFNKTTGEEFGSWSSQDGTHKKILGIDTDENNLFINSYDGILSIDPRTNNRNWEYLFKKEEVWNYAYSTSNGYLYQGNKIESNGSSLPYSDSAHLVRYDLVSGDRTIMHTSNKSSTLEDSPYYHPPIDFVTEDSQNLLIFQLGFLSPLFNQRELTPHLIAIDADTKEIIWIDSSFCELGAGINFPPIVFGDNVLMIADWSIYSYSAETGELNWRTELIYTKNRNGFLFSGPKIYNDVLYVISDAGVIYAVDANTGSLKYSKINIDSNPIKTGPAPGAQPDLLIKEGLIFVNSWSNKEFLIFDASNGELLEKYSDRTYSGENILYDEELDMYYITTTNSIRAFKVER